MLRFSLATIILQLFVFPLLVSATSPPDKVVLVEPPTEVEVNTTVCFGWAQPTDAPHYYGASRAIHSTGLLYVNSQWGSGFVEAVNISTYASNGTNVGSVGVGTDSGKIVMDCGYYPGITYNGCTVLTDVGTYTVVWNFTYVMSAEPQKANATSCGPAPFSSQSFVLNRTVEATAVSGEGAGPGPSYTNAGFTVSTTLPAKPTGDLQLAGVAGVRVPGKILMLGVAAAMYIMIMAL